VIGAGSHTGALLVDGLGDGLLLEASDKDFDFHRNTSFNLLQGCRMRDTKTVCSSSTNGLVCHQIHFQSHGC
jgi:(E)-4-hydroxy-3-methylbut-2-enyl-diphosphate synthase